MFFAVLPKTGQIKSESASLSIFFDILKTGFSKSPKGPPFTIFDIVRFFKMTIFVLKLGFLRGPARYTNLIFLTPAFFFQFDYFLVCFIEAHLGFYKERKILRAQRTP